MIDLSETLSRKDVIRRVGITGIAAALGGGGLGVATDKAKASTVPDIIPEWFGAWTSDDPPSSLASFYSVDSTYEDVAWAAYVLGPDIENYLRGTLAGLSDVQRHMRGSFAVGNLAAVEQLVTGANQGLFPGAPFGAAFQCYAVTIFEFDGNLLSRTVDYYDIAGILMQLGVWPTLPAIQEPEPTEDDCGTLCKKSG